MHLQQRYGMTINEIKADGFDDVVSVAMPDTGDTPAGTVDAMGACMSGMARAFGELQPGVVVITGGRFGMRGPATAGRVVGVPGGGRLRAGGGGGL